MKAKAYKSTVVIDKIKEEVKTRTGLSLPDDKAIRYKLGKAVKVGPDVEGLKEGDEFYYDNMGESEIRVEGKKYWVISDKDIKVIL